MLYPAELQALPQPRGVTVAQDFSSCQLEVCHLVYLVYLVCLVE